MTHPESAQMPTKYRKIPVEIDAFKCGRDPLPDWFMDKVTTNEIILHTDWDLGWCEINTLEGLMRANRGDYVIKGVKGEIYPCKPDIFEATYLPATPDARDTSAGEVEKSERDMEQLIQERDEAEEAISQAYYLITGKSPEWSNAFGYAEALEEIDDAQRLLRQSLAPRQTVPAGWKLVPADATVGMTDAAILQNQKNRLYMDRSEIAEMYKAMLAKTP